MNDYNGRIAVISGGANGIGEALARALAKRGAKVVIADINDALGEKIAADITRTGGAAKYLHVDVSVEESMSALFGEAQREYGRIDLVFNNAGISVAGDSRDLSLDQWRKVTDVNYWGVVYGSKFAFDLMAEQGHGHIINIASLAGLIPFPTNLPYSATKFAVVGLSMSLRAEGVDLGVKVSAVCPGFIASNIFDATEMVNVPKTDIVKSIPFKLVTTGDAAEKILNGVSRNKAIIIFPGYAKLFWGLYRLRQSLLNSFSLKTIRDMRKMRGRKKIT
jgi:NAD(P)-dependent dehydrogenase (short-subunit alcohol dehydrogenase family)